MLLLARGDAITKAERQRTIARLAKYTGLRPQYIDQSNLRINIHSFCKELLRDKKRTVGRIDSRFVGIDGDHTGQQNEHDPSISALMPPYVSTFNQYVRQELGYKSDLEYNVFNKVFQDWNWGSAGQGIYDLATPYFATEYTLNHMSLDPTLRHLFETGEFESGHMMYIHGPSLEKLKSDVARFVG